MKLMTSSFFKYSWLIFSLFIIGNIQPASSNSCSTKIKNKVALWSIKKIESSDISDIYPISCDEANEINELNEDKILITTGRKRGKAIICLSDAQDYPCKFRIGTINDGYEPGLALSKIYSYQIPKSTVFNETVERLFLKPSTLIQ